MITRIVLDTNVVVSAYLWGGTALEILKRVELGELAAFTCRQSLDELDRVLTYPKFRLSAQFAQDIMAHYRDITHAASVRVIPRVIEDDPTDNVFLALAISCKAAYIISGNRHLLKLRQYQGIKILSPRQFLSEIIRG